MLAEDLMRERFVPLVPGDSIDRAVEMFSENDLPELPVVTNRTDRQFLGMVRRTDVARVYLGEIHAKLAPTGSSHLIGPM